MFTPDNPSMCGCDCGFLPYTVTLTPINVPDYSRVFHGNLLPDSCFGSGARAVVTGPGGANENRGPITGVALRDGGCGYAVLGRVQPQILIRSTGALPEGVQLVPSFEQTQDSCGRIAWRISGVTFTGDTPVVSGSQISFTQSPSSVADKIASAQSISATTRHEEPTLEANISASANVAELPEFEVLYQQTTYAGKEAWAIQEIQVLSGGSGYGDLSTIAVSLSLGEGDRKVNFGAAIATGTIQGDEIVSVSVSGTALYAKRLLDSISVSSGGVYYRESPEAPPIVADVLFELSDSQNFFATKPLIAGEVDSNPESATFGNVVGLQIEDAGDGVLAWTDSTDHYCNYLSQDISGVPFVLKAATPIPLVSICFSASFGTNPPVDATKSFAVLPQAVISHPQWNGQPTGIKEEWLELKTLSEFSATGLNLALRGRKAPTASAREQDLTGSGLEVDFQFNQIENDQGLPAWVISGGSINSGGSGYFDGDTASVSADFPGTSNKLGLIAVKTRAEPQLAVVASSGAAQFSVTIAQESDSPLLWGIQSVSVVSGGQGYDPGTASVSVDYSYPVIQVSPATLSVQVQSGQITSVSVLSPGAYYTETGTVNDIEVLDGGEFYEEDASLPPIVADVQASVVQRNPSSGSGAQLSVGINADPESFEFGRATGLIVTAEGSGYLLLAPSNAFAPYSYHEGYENVIDGFPCSYITGCGYNPVLGWNGIILTMAKSVIELSSTPQPFQEPNLLFSMPPTILGADGCASFQGTLQPLVPETPPEMEIAIESGGSWLSHRGDCCYGCYPGSMDLPLVSEIVVTVNIEYSDPFPDSQETVLTLTAGGSWVAQETWQSPNFSRTTFVRASLGAGGLFGLSLTINPTPDSSFNQLTRTKILKGVNFSGGCYPEGYEQWHWQQAEGGEQYQNLIPGNELPEFQWQGYNIASVSSSVTVVYQ